MHRRPSRPDHPLPVRGSEIDPSSPGRLARPGLSFGRRGGQGAGMRLRVATWNINSVRLRADQVARFVAETRRGRRLPPGDQVPRGRVPRAKPSPPWACRTCRIAGQKGWHGVAIVSRLPIADASPLDACREGHARCVGGVIAGVEVRNFYIPAGGDTPDRALNPKFDHKLDFYERLTADMAARDPKAPLLLAGDFNIAPGEHDVWNHRHMSRIVSHTPVEVETLAQASGLARLRRPRARGGSRAAEAVQLVELPRRRLPRLQPRPAAGPPLGLARPAPPPRARQAGSRRGCTTTCGGGSGPATTRR